MKIKACDTYFVEILMAGSIEHAKQICRKFCKEIGLCVTIEETSYIYTGGEELGFRIRLINYPKFESSPENIFTTAKQLANVLKSELAQDSFCLLSPEITEWSSDREL